MPLVEDVGRITMRPDAGRPGDAAFKHDGRTVLPLDRQITGQKRDEWWERSPEIASMAALQNYNDQQDTTFDIMITQP